MLMKSPPLFWAPVTVELFTAGKAQHGSGQEHEIGAAVMMLVGACKSVLVIAGVETIGPVVGVEGCPVTPMGAGNDIAADIKILSQIPFQHDDGVIDDCSQFPAAIQLVCVGRGSTIGVGPRSIPSPLCLAWFDVIAQRRRIGGGKNCGGG